MSLVRTIVRLCAVAALRSQTMADERVADSSNTPLAEALTNQPDKPYIVVYTDDDVKTEITGRQIYDSRRSLSLILELGVASGVTILEDGEVKIHLPATDAAMEFSVDILETQALDALFGNPRSEWAEMLRRLVLGVQRMPSRRGGAVQGTRYAARQVVLVLDVISDPPLGVPLQNHNVIQHFIEYAKDSDVSGMTDAANIVETVLRQDIFTSWEQAQAWLGLTRKGIAALGIAPGAHEQIDAQEEPSILREVTTEQQEWVEPAAVTDMRGVEDHDQATFRGHTE